jgi:peptidoglycan/xylan/chitin deacetylase (PgdA/CDA1 family)
LGFGGQDMSLISPLLKHVVYPSLARTGYLRHSATADSLAIVTYHGVLPPYYRSLDPSLDGSLVSADSFRRQLRLLKARYQVISPEQFLLWCQAKQPLPPRAVLLTCDDGLRNVLTEMLPILQEEKLKCLFFVTGYSAGDLPSRLWYEELYLMFLATPESIALELADLGVRAQAEGRQAKRSLWSSLVRNLSQCDVSTRRRLLQEIRMRLGLSHLWNSFYLEDAAQRSRFLMLDQAEVRRLAAAGMTIGSHTLSHPMLSQLPPELAWKEMAESRTTLERVLGTPVWAVAYPFGDTASVTARETEMAERAGYQCAFINMGGGLGADLPLYALPRVHVTSDMGLAEFEAHVSGFGRSLRERFRAQAS